MTHYWWCKWCGQNVVDHSGDPCGLCVGSLEAMIAPIVHDPLPPRAPLGVRILRLIGRTVA